MIRTATGAYHVLESFIKMVHPFEFTVFLYDRFGNEETGICLGIVEEIEQEVVADAINMGGVDLFNVVKQMPINIFLLWLNSEATLSRYVIRRNHKIEWCNPYQTKEERDALAKEHGILIEDKLGQFTILPDGAIVLTLDIYYGE